MKKMILLVAAISALSWAVWANGDPSPKPGATGEAMKPARITPYAVIIAPDDSLSHLRFLADGKLSLNDRCPVRKVALNPRMGASYVNGEPVGFC